MDRERAYLLLARELERFRRLPRQDLARLVGGPAIERTVWDGSEPWSVEVRAEWADAEAGAIRIRATANGPGSWRMGRFEETAFVRLPDPEP